jgi:hypothetical protein
MDQKNTYSEINHQEHLSQWTVSHMFGADNIHEVQTTAATNVNHQCVFHQSMDVSARPGVFVGQHSYMTQKEDMMISASWVVGVVNMDTRKAHKKPRNPAIKITDCRKKELTNAATQNERRKPRYGSDVRALDNRIGVCAWQVCHDTSHRETRHRETIMIQPKIQSRLKSILCTWCGP